MTTNNLTTEISNAVAKLMNYVNQGDLDNMVAMYTDDTSVLPPGEKSIYGIEAVREFWNEMLHQVGFSDVAYTIEKIEPLGNDTAAELTSYEVTLAGERRKGKYTVIWKKVQGEWKLHVDIFNVAMPS
jgi:uncharacterized protein (TIGR02246 family)